MTASEFKQRFIPHTAAMYRTAFRLTGNAQEAEDMVQEAFIRLWQRRDKVPDVADEAAYCATIVHHVCVDALRRRRPDLDPHPPEALPLTDAHDAAYELERHEARQRMQQAIGQLPASQRQVVQMRHLDDRSIADIQAQTGFTAGNIRVLLSRARRQLKILLRNETDH